MNLRVTGRGVIAGTIAAMAFAARTRMSPLVMGIMTINGAHAGAFSPISVSGVLVRDIVESNGLSIAPWTLFLASYGINLLLSVLTVLGTQEVRRVKIGVGRPETRAEVVDWVLTPFSAEEREAVMQEAIKANLLAPVMELLAGPFRATVAIPVT